MSSKITKQTFDSLPEEVKNRLTEDGLVNIYTHEGMKGKDKNTGYSFQGEALLDENEPRQIYRANGIGRKIVDRPVSDMTRKWIAVSGDTDGLVLKYFRKLKLKSKIKEALTWAKVFGGSAIVMGIDDGGELEDPVNMDSIKGIRFLKVYDRYRITFNSADKYDEESDKFGEIEKYYISPIDGEPFKVHETRMLIFQGPMTDERTKKNNNWWNESIYRAIKTELINFNSVYNSSKNIMDDFIQIILKMKDLQSLVVAGQEEKVKTRLNLLDLGRHMMNTILLDENEDYTKEASTISGIDKLLQEFQQALSAVTNIPMTVLMGRSPGGMNSTGDSDIRIYYDDIADSQEEEMYFQLCYILELSLRAKEGPTKGVYNEDWDIEFKPLWQPTEKEIVETRKTQSETDKAYIELGVLSSSEVANSRFGGDDYSHETVLEFERKPIDPNEFKEKPKEEEEEEETYDLDDILRVNTLLDAHSRLPYKGFKGDVFETEETDNHSHYFYIHDAEKGNGWTFSDDPANHYHMIKGWEVQIHYNDVTQVSHTHELSNSIRKKLRQLSKKA